MASCKSFGELNHNGEEQPSVSENKRVKAVDKRHKAALILAREDGEGIPLKYIKTLAGGPLIEWVLQAAVDSKLFDSVWVLTNHDDIEKVVRSLGAKIHRISAEVSTSLDAVREFIRLNPEVDIVCQIQATFPCLHPFHLKEALEYISDCGYDCVFSVVRRRHLCRQEVKAGTDELTHPLNLDPYNRPRRQDWDGELCEKRSFYCSTTEFIKKEALLQGGKVAYYEMAPEYSMNIDGDIDWPVAKERVLKYGFFGRGSPEVVKLLFCNIFGCLTEGRIFLSISGHSIISVNVLDEAGIRMLKADGVEVILLSSKLDPVADALSQKLTRYLGCEVLSVGENPLKDIQPLVKERKLSRKQVAYMGNDEVDVDCLNMAGLSAVPSGAPVVALYICKAEGGKGAVREFAEHIRLQTSFLKRDHIDLASS